MDENTQSMEDGEIFSAEDDSRMGDMTVAIHEVLNQNTATMDEAATVAVSIIAEVAATVALAEGEPSRIHEVIAKVAESARGLALYTVSLDGDSEKAQPEDGGNADA